MNDTIHQQKPTPAQWLARAEAGDPEAQFRVALNFQMGFRAEKNPEESLKWALRSAEQGFLAALIFLGQKFALGIGGADKNFEEAFKWLSKAAEQDAPYALALLGKFYRKGLGTEPNPSKAFEYYSRAAEKSPSYGAFGLADLYAQGIGVAQNEAQANKWYLVAADSGNDVAALCVGLCHWQGHEPVVALAKTIYWYQTFSKDEITTIPAFFALTDPLPDRFRDGRLEAIKKFKNASENENPTAQTILGMLSGLGILGPKNIESAKLWLERASKNLNPMAQQLLNRFPDGDFEISWDDRYSCHWFGMKRK